MPARVLLQDFTGVPAVVDLAAMRDAMRNLGGDPTKINPLLPAELVIDHSVQVDKFGAANVFAFNAELEMQRNIERYAFLRWGQKSFRNFKVVPPDTGICHQVNLEYLARVVFGQKQNGEMVAFPDSLVGTDSHTTMVNGLGVFGWGVGGIEAEAAMLGQPLSMLIPAVVGFKLHGRLPKAPPRPTSSSRSRKSCARKASSENSSNFTAPDFRASRFPTAPRSPTWRRSTARRWAFSRSMRKRSRTCASPRAAKIKCASSKPTRKNRDCSAPTRRPTQFLRPPRTRSRHRRPHDGRTEAPAGQRSADAGEIGVREIARRAAAQARQRAEQRRPLRTGRWLRRDRRDHQLHEHVESFADARRGPAREESRRARAHHSAVGENEFRARLESRHRLHRESRTVALSRIAAFPSRRLRLHHLHRQQRTAVGADQQGHQGQQPRRRFRPQREPQFRGPHQSALPRELSGVAAAGGGVRARGPHGHRHRQRAARQGQVRRIRVPARHLAHARRKSRPRCALPSRATCSARNMPTSSPATIAGARCRFRKAISTRGTRNRPTSRIRRISNKCPSRPARFPTCTACARWRCLATASPPITFLRPVRFRRIRPPENI